VRTSDIVRHHLGLLAANGIRNAAVIVLENAGGRVAAYVGNTPDMDTAAGGHVDVIRHPRSTGSLLKPFLYTAMLSEGLLLPEQLVPDVPTRYPGFSPENNTGAYRGAVPAYMALARSLNVPAIRLLREYSIDRFYGDLQALGMSTLFRNAADYGLPLIIGGAEGTLWELAGMYAGLARSARGHTSPYFAPTVYADAGNEAAGTARFSTGAAYLTLEALLRVQRPGVEERWEEFAGSERIAWKTGTSQGFRDAWALGVTRDYTVGVWVGNADGEPRPELGGTAAAAPILFAIFDYLPDAPWFERPIHDLARMEVCALSGLPPGPNCDRTKIVEVPRTAHYPEPCPYCVTVHLDASGSWRTNAIIEEGRPIQHVSWFVLPPAMEWFYRQGNADYRVLPPYRPGAEPDDGVLPLSLIYPHDGSQIYLPRELDGAPGGLVAEAVHRDTRARIFWHLDATYLGVTEGIHTMAIHAPSGEHTLTLVDQGGELLERRFTLLARGE
jgi:penicillin-binding protein 1C